ncbi:MAG: hypothetical protein KKG75_03410 [Nanoarchaeota archaeon]|nr:hypothetical protein [Nanoarchaeota archaeon]
MKIQTNWNMNLEKTLELHKEVVFLSKRFRNCFDWRILLHPIGGFSLNKVIEKLPNVIQEIKNGC